MAKLRPWLILIVFATMMTVAYVAIFRASHQAHIREVPLAQARHAP